jgi:hypothetical protein|tara:strand:+ start:226 stop:594 length:369 start_codon:yes stop_codon:yes gene_type:complete
MSEFMLNDEDAINDVNPFVQRDFSLPGGVRQTGNFEDFQEVPKSGGIPPVGKSIFCTVGLCAGEKKPCRINRNVQPRRNIDDGMVCRKPKKKIKVGVSNRKFPWNWVIISMIIVLALLILRP